MKKLLLSVVAIASLTIAAPLAASPSSNAVGMAGGFSANVGGAQASGLHTGAASVSGQSASGSVKTSNHSVKANGKASAAGMQGASASGPNGSSASSGGMSEAEANAMASVNSGGWY